MKEPRVITVEQRRRALHRVLYEAITEARGLAGGRWPMPGTAVDELRQEIVDLMDAIHNIPLFLDTMEGWDDDLFRSYSLQGYDGRWAAKRGHSLTNVYDEWLKSDAEREQEEQDYWDSLSDTED